jgi:hypothetical protein
VLAQSSSSGDVIVGSDRVIKVPVCTYNWAEYRVQVDKYWKMKDATCEQIHMWGLLRSFSAPPPSPLFTFITQLARMLRW